MRRKTRINGYDIEVEDEDGADTIQCWIVSEKLRASASLACLEATGCLTGWGSNFDEHPVSEATIEKIADWADKNGYND